MDNTYKEVIKEHAFTAVVGSDIYKDGFKPYSKYLSDHFNNGGSVIYIDSKKENKGLDHLSKLLEIDLNFIHKEGRIIFVCRDDYLKEGSMNIIGLLNAIEEGLNSLNKKGSSSNQIYITIDYLWCSMGEDKLKFAYNRLKGICKEKNATFIFRYIVEDLKKEHIQTLLMNHKALLLCGINDFEVPSPFQQMFRSLVLLSKYYAIDEKYKEEMKRLEYLKTLGDLMEDTVHDINNLLATISGYAQLSLVLEQSMGQPSEIADYLRIINNTALDGKNVIEKIKGHIKGSYDSKKGYYNLDDIVDSCIEMAKHKVKSANRDGIRLKLDMDLNSGGYIYGNEYELRQAMLNIVLNGIDAMEGSGVLSIRTYNVGNQIVLEIEDTGPGIDRAILNKIFDPYFTTKGSKGTGLGLNIVKRMIDNYKGQIYVNSEIGKGTKFTIYFPIAECRYNIAETINKSYNNI